MKATLLVDNDTHNPAYKEEDRLRAVASGEAYNIKPYITLKAGETIHGDGVFELCTCPNPKAIPADDEASRKVMAYLDSPARKARKDKLLSMARPEVLKDLPPAKKKYVEYFAKKWQGSDIDKIDSGEKTPPAKK